MPEVVTVTFGEQASVSLALHVRAMREICTALKDHDERLAAMHALTTLIESVRLFVDSAEITSIGTPGTAQVSTVSVGEA